MIILLLDNIYNWFNSLTKSEIILLLTFLTIIWYTIETFKLRKWQQKNVQISILDLRQRILMHQDEMFSKNLPMGLNIQNRDVINIMNDILEYGKFDLKQLYATGIIKENLKKGFLKKWFGSLLNFFKTHSSK